MSDQKDHFDEMTKYLSIEARWFALDSMACAFHNAGYSMQGNTEANDVLWLARNIRSEETFGGNDFDQLPEERKRHYMGVASVAIKCLPALCERISARYINLSKAISTISKVAGEQTRQMRQDKERSR